MTTKPKAAKAAKKDAPPAVAGPGRDLDERYRPRTLDQVVGQPEAVSVIESWGQSVPRCVLLHGPSGVGKTTLALAVCRDVLKVTDLRNVNCGTVEEPQAFVRGIQDTLRYRPLNGGTVAYILDEAQTFTRSPGAAQALLKVMEDCPEWVWFFVCTTDPQKLLPAIITRCVDIGLKDVSDREIQSLVERVRAAEGLPALDPEVLDGVVACARNSPRMALKYLEKVGALDPEAALAALGAGFGEASDEFDLARRMIYDRQRAWPNVAAVLTKLEDSDPEGLRRMLLGCARKQLLAGKEVEWNFKIITMLEKPLFDRAVGKALLVAWLYECFRGGK